MSELVIYTFVNKDLKMDKGKIASQIVHATFKLGREVHTMKERVQQNYEAYMFDTEISKTSITYKATQEELLEILENEQCVATIDSGRTQVAPGSMTVVMLYPIPKTTRFSSFKLL